MIRQRIVKTLQKVTRLDDIHVEYPEREEYGDYSTNVALQMGKNPRKAAEEIVAELKKDKELSSFVDEIKIAGPGFINFYLKTEYLQEKLAEIDEKFGSSDTKKNKKVIVEYTDPNPFKEFHIGHLYSNTVGESICRILESQGTELRRVNYQGDIGLHVAKSVWGMKQKFLSGKSSLNELKKEDLAARIKFMGQAYALGATEYSENKQTKSEIDILNKIIYENSYKEDREAIDIYDMGRLWSLEYFEKIYKRLGTKFDFYYFESEVGKIGLEIVKKNMTNGIFEHSPMDGRNPVVFHGEKYGLHTRVFINSLGLPTYEAKELGLAPTKYKNFKYDLSIIITANEIDEYFKVLIAALKEVSPELGNKTMHLSHGVVKLPEGKMSSRTGKIVTGEWLLDEAKKRITEKHKMGNETTEIVAVGAIKYELLKSHLGQDITFNFNESISIEGNSGPYIQYTFARTQSVLDKARNSNIETRNKFEIQNTENLNNEELAIMRTLVKFPEIVEQAALNYSPNVICNYIYDLASKYNTFYNKHKIIGSENEEFRIKLTDATGVVLKNGLNLLGIKAPEKM